MDDTDLLKMSGASAGTVAIILLIYRVLKSVLGKRFISHCCGKKMEVGIDVKEGVTPKEEVKIEIKTNPMLEKDGSTRKQDEQEHSIQQ
jgi:hypothetical protein